MFNRILNPRKHWLWLYLFINFLAAFIIYNTGDLIGDVAGRPLSSVSNLIISFLAISFSYIIILWVVFELFSKIKTKTSYNKENDFLVSNYIGIYIFIFQFLFLIFNFFTGANISGQHAGSGMSIATIFWALLPIDALFLIYYGVARDSKYFKINLALYLISNLMRGWAGVILIVIFMEWCRLYRMRKINIKYILLVAILILIIYPELHLLKYSIRVNDFQSYILNHQSLFLSVYGDINYFSSILIGVEHIIARIQIVSVLTEIFKYRDFFEIDFYNNIITPYWYEGLHGVIIDRLFDYERSLPLGVVFTGYGDFNWSFNQGDWVTNVGYPSWYFITPIHSAYYLLFTLLICFISMLLMKKISLRDSAMDLLWLSWMLYLLPPWFGTFIQFVYALFIYLMIKMFISSFVLGKK